MEFDKSKILTVVTADQAKVGQKGWFGDELCALMRMVWKCKPMTVRRIEPEFYCRRFMTDQDIPFALFYPAPEPTTYAERQAQWVKENNVKVGTKVRVTRTFTEDEDGSYCLACDDLVGMTGIIRNICSRNLGVYIKDRNFKVVPYFVLEVIKEPTYRPFKNAEEFKPYRDEWFVSKCDNSKSSSANVQNYNNLGVILLREFTKNDDVVFDLCRWDEFFQWFTRENGEPCGVRVEA